ncbi:hypothetical protein [Flavobacterium reichenbachii]|uniref:Uncharacterized protein n=1 Tax=Flavobacterium reichenbachii TaxID=362418 RepID=A0A085ZQM1_9FLAO|nr:hypothetical protein [Flavobacterium reichenbachii]KFF06735.1 hypothetical protein IW19_15025 [Flavobacterium reichenbachii]OXB18661.1 hypothetical protein B0A68_01185 [Flavobacterium reichenbachii]
MKNLKKIPKIIVQAKVADHLIDYKWTPKIMEKLIDPVGENEGLEHILNQISHKASMGLAAATLEWIFWRFKELSTKSEDIRQRIETMWSSIENPENTNDLVFDIELDFPANNYIDGPIWVSLMNVRMIDILYKKGSNFLQTETLGLILLARHITPKKKTFDKWFDDNINKLINFYPNQNLNSVNDLEDSLYDYSKDPVICREFFFDSSFEYNEEQSKKALSDFISNINYQKNQYCIKRKEYASA